MSQDPLHSLYLFPCTDLSFTHLLSSPLFSLSTPTQTHHHNASTLHFHIFILKFMSHTPWKQTHLLTLVFFFSLLYSYPLNLFQYSLFILPYWSSSTKPTIFLSSLHLIHIFGAGTLRLEPVSYIPELYTPAVRSLFQQGLSKREMMMCATPHWLCGGSVGSPLLGLH